MSDGDALFATILARPDEDVPRLAYADWLDEFGGERDRARAELIRIQIEIASIPEVLRTSADVRFLELRTRELALLATHMDDWLAPLRGPGAPLQSGEAHAQFRRGFVEIVWLPAGMFVQRAGALFARAPVRELRVTRGVIGEVTELLGGSHFPRLHALDLSDRRLGDDVARVLARRTNAALRARPVGANGTGRATQRDRPRRSARPPRPLRRKCGARGAVMGAVTFGKHIR